MVQRQVGEQRVDRREARVARGRSVSPLALEMFEERRDERRVELGDVEPAWWGAGASRGEPEQQPERQRVGGDRVLARRSLAEQPIGEERLQRRCERAHRRFPKRASSRPAASVISSGVADRYQ